MARHMANAEKKDAQLPRKVETKLEPWRIPSGTTPEEDQNAGHRARLEKINKPHAIGMQGWLKMHSEMTGSSRSGV